MRDSIESKGGSANQSATQGVKMRIEIQDGQTSSDLRIRIQSRPGPVPTALIAPFRDAGLHRIRALADRVRSGESVALDAVLVDARIGSKIAAAQLWERVRRGEPAAVAIALGATDDPADASFSELVDRIRAGDEEAVVAVWNVLQERHTQAVALLVDRLRADDGQVAAKVFDEFAGRLMGLARSRLYPRVQQITEPEDIVISAYASFFKGGVINRGLADYNHLWATLAVIVVRKCCKHNRRFGRDGTLDDPAQFEWIAVDGLDPSAEATLGDLLESLVASFEDESDKQVVRLYLAGFKQLEIAQALGRSVRAIQRVTQRLWRRLNRMGLPDPRRHRPPEGE